MNETVSHLIELLGKPTVFINWPRGVKGTKRKWKHLTFADMTPTYLEKLAQGNIGVALGEISGGLCAIDLDDAKFVDPFLALNPHLKDTLQTHGARGRVFWARFKGDYPKRTIKLKTHSGEDIGEFRSNGGQSIVWGIHPHTKQPYQFVIEQNAIEADFKSIVWLSEIANKPTLANYTEEQKYQKIQKSRGTEELKSLACGVRSPFHSTINTIEDSLRISMPTKKRENNALLFKLARAIKTLEFKGQSFDLSQLEAIFDQWHTRAEKFLREGQTREDYYLEFMNALQEQNFRLEERRLLRLLTKPSRNQSPPRP